MARRRPMSPYWDGAIHGAVTPASADGSSEFARAIRGLVTKIVDPNRPDPSNPVINGATGGQQSWLRNVIANIATQLPRVGNNFELLSSIADTKLFEGGIVNDREYQMEKVIQLVASLAMRTPEQDSLSNAFIKTLWNNLHHPPLSLLGPEFRYRTADGSNNNIMYPQLGKAGSSYARTVVPQTLQPGVLPDPGDVFDALFARWDQPREHPNKISSMLFYLGSIIIHDVFITDSRDSTKVKTSSYLDLAPLYGSSEEELASVRTFQDGLLKPDTFCESRVLGFPPGVSALLVCFNRYHNYVAMQLKVVNENGRFATPHQTASEADWKRNDNDLFQTARLITCGLYINVILNDYVRTILNLNRTDKPWTLDPRENFNEYYDEHGTPAGIGNQVSVEFNLVYRWHSAISVKDEQWTNDVYSKIFPNQNVSELTEEEFKMGLHKHFVSQGADPAKWNLDFNRYRRNKAGKFSDEDLVKILTEATEDVACAFGARQVPVAMRLVEIMGIKQARAWNVATLNEFRKFFQLKPYTRFSDISSDHEVAHALKSLYKHPDYVELYPGLIAEDAKEPMTPGSGMCPGFTISRTILADAVALVRGDRFYTTDFSPASLTNWGWNQIQSDEDVAFGHCIHNLFQRALPNWYRGASVYAMFPFVIPSENRKILHSLQKEQDYCFERPKFIPVPDSANSWYAVRDILSDTATFRVPWGDHTQALIGNQYEYMLSGDDPQTQVQRHDVYNAMYCPVNGMNEVREFYEALTTQLVEIRSERLRGEWYQLDACRDVANSAHAIFVARLWLIPLKGAGDKVLGVEVDKLYQALSVAFAYVFLDADTARSFKLHFAAKSACDELTTLVKIVCAAVKTGSDLHVSDLFQMGRAGKMLGEYGRRLLERLIHEQGKSVDEVASIIIPTAAAAVATQAQHFTEMINLYLSDEYKHHWKDIRKCAWSDDPADFEKLKKYALEANRLAPAAFGVLRKANKDTVVKDGEWDISLDKDDQIYVNFVAAGRDKEKFPNPEQIDLTRNHDDYIHHGWGKHRCLGREMVEIAMAAQLRVFAKLKNLRRAPGLQGQMKTSSPETNAVSSDPKAGPEGIKVFMKEDWSDWWPFPTTLKVQHDGFFKTQDDYLSMDTGLPHRNTELKESRLENGEPATLRPDARVNGGPTHDRDCDSGEYSDIVHQPHRTNGVNGVDRH